MADGRGRRRLFGLLGPRARAAAILGVVLALGAGPAWAYWKAQQTEPSQTFTFGTLDLQLNGQDTSAAVSSLALGSIMPGQSVAGIVTTKNNGSIPLSYWLTIVGSNTDTKGLANWFDVVVTSGGTVAGSSPNQTCNGGTAVAAITRTSTSSQVLAYGPAAANRHQLLPGNSENLCVQLTLSLSTPDLQGATTTMTITSTGEQVGQP